MCLSTNASLVAAASDGGNATNTKTKDKENASSPSTTASEAASDAIPPLNEMHGETDASAATLLDLLSSINQPQSLASNLSNLRNIRTSTASSTTTKAGSDKTGGKTSDKTNNNNPLSGIPALLHLLSTHPHHGVTTASVPHRRSLLGTNSLPSPPSPSWFQLFVDTFDDATLQILIVAALVSLGIGLYDDPTAGYIEGVAILGAVLVVSVVTACNDYSKECQFRALSQVDEGNATALVLRDGGKARSIPVGDIVVGDVVVLEAGDSVPCDGVLLRGSDNLQLDESALTGEPLDVDKSASNVVVGTDGAEPPRCEVGDPFVLSGCTVSSGSCQFVAVAVGPHSQWGVIKSHLEKEHEPTPLQEKLDVMAVQIGYVGMAAAVATFVAMMILKLYVKPDYLNDVTVANHALDAFIIGVTVVVVAVPEGLPLAVTISLAYSTRKMLRDRNLIRHLAACETMGNATSLCTDKTGTLTENRMTVVKGTFADQSCVLLEGGGGGGETKKNQGGKVADVSNKALQVILNGIGICSTARIIQPSHHDTRDDTDDAKDTRPQIIGNQTEAALLLLATGPFGKYDDYESRRSKANLDGSSSSDDDEKKGGGNRGGGGEGRLFPFSSDRKCMSVLVQEDQDDEEEEEEEKKEEASSSWTLYHKGAAETVLQKCSMYLDASGNELPLTVDKRREYESILCDYASDALRCVALSHRRRVDIISAGSSSSSSDASDVTMEYLETTLEQNMCLDALVGIADPLRPDVVEAVKACQNAGVVVRMVTGDNVDTANAIARQAGILTEGGLSMTGEEFRSMTPSKLDEILPRLQVLARSSPEDKHTLVTRLNGKSLPKTETEWLESHPGKDYDTQKDLLLPGYYDEWAKHRNGGVGEVVGVTGDGTNDGPALKAADVGLSMGLSGTDVAKNASDIVILDDNFASIVKAVLWGRSVFDNIRKFLQFQLTVNVVALTITFLSAVAGYKPPLNAVMMLWVNLIMDTMGALALGTEPPTKELLDRRPYRRDASLINRPMWRNILFQSAYQLALLIYLLKEGPALFGCEDGSAHHFTIIFNAFVFCQIFNEFNAREIGDRFNPLRNLHNSPMFVFIIAMTVLLQYVIVTHGGDFTQTHALTMEEWKSTVLLGAVSIPVGFIMRQIPISEDPESFAGIVKAMPSNKSSGSVLTFVVPLVAVAAYHFYHGAAWV